MNNLKHYAVYRQTEYIILGFNAADGTCLLCNVAALPVGEQQHLRMIASSVVAQNTDYLVPILQKEQHPSKSDWFSYLATRHRRRDESVVKLPLKELENLNADQKAVFKGYKKPEKATVLDDDDERGSQVDVASPLEKKLDALVDASAQTQALLAQLVQLQINGSKPIVEPAKRSRSRSRSKPAVIEAA